MKLYEMKLEGIAYEVNEAIKEFNIENGTDYRNVIIGSDSVVKHTASVENNTIVFRKEFGGCGVNVCLKIAGINLIEVFSSIGIEQFLRMVKRELSEGKEDRIYVNDLNTHIAFNIADSETVSESSVEELTKGSFIEYQAHDFTLITIDKLFNGNGERLYVVRVQNSISEQQNRGISEYVECYTEYFAHLINAEMYVKTLKKDLEEEQQNLLYSQEMEENEK